MINFFKIIFEIFSSLISPPFCEGCKNYIQKRSILCNRCFDKINPVVSTNIKISEKYTLTIFAICDYDEPIKNLILSKINKNIVVSKYIGELVWQMTNLKSIEIDYFVPVPLHWTRFVKRGYNQAEIIASILSMKKERPIANIVKRIRYTKYQSSLPYQQKSENIKNAFKLNLNLNDYEKYREKHLVIVDDLLTSGSTVFYLAKELSKLNPKSISAVVACRVT